MKQAGKNLNEEKDRHPHQVQSNSGNFHNLQENIFPLMDLNGYPKSKKGNCR